MVGAVVVGSATSGVHGFAGQFTGVAVVGAGIGRPVASPVGVAAPDVASAGSTAEPVTPAPSSEVRPVPGRTA